MTLYIEATTLALKQSQQAVCVDTSLAGNIVMRIKMCGYSSPKLMPRFSLKQKTKNEDKKRMRGKRDAMTFLATIITSSKERTTLSFLFWPSFEGSQLSKRFKTEMMDRFHQIRPVLPRKSRLNHQESWNLN
jgi:hypothetical protein